MTILSGLLNALQQQEDYQKMLGEIANKTVASLCIIRAARPFVASALALDCNRPVIIITSRDNRAHQFSEQLIEWSADLRVRIFGEPSVIFYQHAAWGSSAIESRMRVLTELADDAKPGDVVISSARSLMQRTLPRQMLLDHSLTLRQGEHIPGKNVDDLLRRWAGAGYEATSVVTRPGFFSHRGGILDVYPIATKFPIRIELWGDQIETMRKFDPATQRSFESIREASVPPAREALPLLTRQVYHSLNKWLAEQELSQESGVAGRISERVALEQGRAFPTIEFYLPYLYNQQASLLDYIPPNSLVLIDDETELENTVTELEAQSVALREAAIRSGTIPQDMPVPLVTWAELSEGLTRLGAVELAGRSAQDGAMSILFAPGKLYGGQIRKVLDDLHGIRREAVGAAVVASRQASRLAELWYERASSGRIQVSEDIVEVPAAGSVSFVRGRLTDGWTLRRRVGPLVFLTDTELFGWQRPEPRRNERRAVVPEDFFADLEPGSFVVHTEYGIGRFEGLEKRVLGGAEREFLLVSYSGGDSLFVPIYQADRLTRYVGANDTQPELSRLGTPEWVRVKDNAQRAVEEIAEELLALYAARETMSGHAFGPDTAWQHELEASFAYSETDDQLRALTEVKADMESSRPMDRMICGDVGYGKTEVALRAAFKAVMDGKQVAILVPTTVLAQQHEETFSQRLSSFPVKVEMLSRFRSQAEQAAIIQELASGQIDIVIGTHRLLGSDVTFSDLGLLVIDEEQRFGVTHKEKLKALRTEVDVLTMTATPIPRTLYMSLTGVRDISTIDTAPEERQAVITFVGQRNDDLIRQAVLRELDRGGQVYFVHNRVQTIYTQAEYLQELVPEAIIAVGHGQMPEAALESVMGQFLVGKIDVLVSTSIIEAGLDIPNANTLIVDHADMFGLSQLHQLRGRVGRSAKRAFAYFFHPGASRLTPEALARLETIADQSELGAGMNIAMRDLEIRGAGDILGTRQHGQIAAVGFHLYTRMLAQAVSRLRSDRRSTPQDRTDDTSQPANNITIDLPLPVFIPTDYVADAALRIQIYRRMAELDDDSSIEAMRAELADRFGTPPQSVENLLYQLRVRHYASRAGVDSITSAGAQLSIRMSGLAHFDRELMQKQVGSKARVGRSAIWLPKVLDSDHQHWRENLIGILTRLREITLDVSTLPATTE